MAGKDDITGEPLMRRKDDNAATLTSRLDAFHKQVRDGLAQVSSSFV